MPSSSSAQVAGRTRFAVALSFFYTGLHSANGVLLPFFAVWLSSRGFSVQEIGLTVALATLTRLISVPLAARIADRTGSTGRVLTGFALLALVLFPLMAMGYGFAALFPFVMLAFFVWNPLMPLADSYGLAGAAKRGLHYGRMRLIGSGAFMVASVATGYAVKAFGISPLILIASGTMALMAFASLFLPADHREKAKSGRSKGALTSGTLVALLMAAAFVQSSHALFYSFGTIHYLALGYADSLAGWLWAVGVISEMTLFFVASQVMRIMRPETMLAVGGIVGTLRWSLASLDPGLEGQVGLQLLHAGTFAINHLGALAVLQARVPSSHQASGQALFVVVAGLTMTVATYLSGLAYEAFAGKAYLMMAGLALTGGMIAAFIRAHPQSEGAGGLTREPS
jgi:PPP family 3-phenylpropionic acid transporter